MTETDCLQALSLLNAVCLMGENKSFGMHRFSHKDY